MELSLESLAEKLRSFVSGAVKPGVSAPGPGDVGPSINKKGTEQSLVTLEMSEEEVRAWWGRVERARARVKARESSWKALLKEYLPIVSSSGEPQSVKVMQHFRNVHTKLGQMFYQVPDLILTPNDPSLLNVQMPNPMSPEAPPLMMEDIVTVKQQVLHKILGRDGIKSSRLVDELLFDVLAWTGFGASKLGYRCVFRPVPEMPSPSGFVLGLQDPQPVPVPVHEEWYWRRFSPLRALWNDDLRSTRFDEDATWMGMEFYMSKRQASQMFGIDPEEVTLAASDAQTFGYSEDSQVTPDMLVHGVEIWCKASYFTDEMHPQAINQLVLIEGIKDRPVVWRPSPDQEFDPTTGRLTKDSLVGFPIQILTIRDLSESAFPMADSAFTDSEIKQLTTWRQQSIQLRDNAVGKYLFDPSAFDAESIRQLQSADTHWIKVSDGQLREGAKTILDTTAQVHQIQDDFRNQQMIQGDINETLGIDANAAGAYTDTVRSATESSNVQANMLGRSGKERARVVDFYLDGARKIDQLLMRYADEEDYIEITGPDGAKRMQVWNRQLIAGKFLYDIAPDSTLQVDTAADFGRMGQYWNLVAKSPLTNQAYVLRRFARMRGLDPAKAVLDPSALEKPEEPKGKFSMSLNGADLANPLVVKMLIDNGIIKPEDAALNSPVQPEPPSGAADKADVISEHQRSNSGGMENAPGASNFRDTSPGD